MSGVMAMELWMRRGGYASGLEEEEEDSFVGIADILGTRNDQGGSIREAGTVGERAEVFTRSERRVGHGVYGK